jgi:hypothetical protein
LSGGGEGEGMNPRKYKKIVLSTGRDLLWGWFGLSYASWLTLPRVLMHEMPDEWQKKMAELLLEFGDTFPNAPPLDTRVFFVKEGKIQKNPDWIQYRHPDFERIYAMK